MPADEPSDDTSADTSDHNADEHTVDDPLVDLGAFIRAQREIARMSVRKLAELADVSNPYLSQIERGMRRPSAEIRRALAICWSTSAEGRRRPRSICDR